MAPNTRADFVAEFQKRKGRIWVFALMNIRSRTYTKTQSLWWECWDSWYNSRQAIQCWRESENLGTGDVLSNYSNLSHQTCCVCEIHIKESRSVRKLFASNRKCFNSRSSNENCFRKRNSRKQVTFNKRNTKRYWIHMFLNFPIISENNGMQWTVIMQ